VQTLAGRALWDGDVRDAANVSDAVRKHGSEHGPYSTDPIRYAHYHHIVKRLNQVVIPETPAAFFTCTKTMDGYRLVDAEAGVVTAGDDTEIEIYNSTTARQMLASNLFVDAGDLSSQTSSSPVAVETDSDGLVSAGDQLHINVVDAGGGTRGLEVVLVFI
jgi:hypothetical protein